MSTATSVKKDKANPIGVGTRVSREEVEARGLEQAGLMTVEEVAAMTGLTRRTIQYQCSRGTIPAVHLGRRWLIGRAAVERLLAPALEA